MDELEKMLLMQVADLHRVPDGAYNIRKNGEGDGRRSTDRIRIEDRKDGHAGIDIFIAPDTKNESVHIPVVITKTDYRERVYNDFYIGENADVLIIAGCGIHNCGVETSEHTGVHTFHIGKGAKVRYVEKHYGSGEGSGENIMNPATVIYQDEDSRFEMESTQIKGIDSTDRETTATLKAGAELVVREKIYTHGRQFARTNFVVDLNGEGAGADVVSRSVAADDSRQTFGHQRQRGVPRPYGVRFHHHGPRLRDGGARTYGQLRGRRAHPRGSHRQDRGRADHQAHDARSHRAGSGRADHQGLPELTLPQILLPPSFRELSAKQTKRVIFPCLPL